MTCSFFNQFIVFLPLSHQHKLTIHQPNSLNPSMQLLVVFRNLEKDFSNKKSTTTFLDHLLYLQYNMSYYALYRWEGRKIRIQNTTQIKPVLKIKEPILFINFYVNKLFTLNYKDY